MDGNSFGRHHRNNRGGAFPFDPQPLEASDDFSAPWPAPTSGIAGASPASASAAVSISHFLPTHFTPPNASAFGAAAGPPANRSATAAQPFLRNDVHVPVPSAPYAHSARSAPPAPSAPSAPSPAAALEFALLESQLLSAVGQQASQQMSQDVKGGLSSAVAGLELVGSAVAGLAADGADAFDLDVVEVARVGVEGAEEREEENGERQRKERGDGLEVDGEAGGVFGGRESRKRRLMDLHLTEGEEGVEVDEREEEDEEDEEGEEEEGSEGGLGKRKKGGKTKEREGEGEGGIEGDAVNGRNNAALLRPSIPTTPSPLLCSESEFQHLLTCIKNAPNEDAISLVLLLLLEEQRAANETSCFLQRLRVVRSEYLHRHHSLVRSIELNLLRDIAHNDAVHQREIQRLRRVCMAGMSAGATLSQHQVFYRTLITRPRSRAWWEECIDPNNPPELFRKKFRMSRETFMELCGMLGPLLGKKPRKNPNLLDIRIGAAIWRLATAEPLHLVSRRFNLSRTTVHFVGNDILKVLNDVILPKVVVWPEPGSTRAAEISSKFLKLCGVDGASSVVQQLGNGQLIGTLYTTHLCINTPRSNMVKYHNRQLTERLARESYSLSTQAVVDANGQFIDLCIGLPGALSDEQVLQQSTLHQKGQAGELQGAKVIGLRSYPLLDWLLVPYAQSESATWYQTTFNECIEKGTAVGKDAIGRLKGRWRILLRRAEGKLHELPRLVGACCALHNFLEQKGEAFDPDWAYEAFDDYVPARRADEESPAAVAERDELAQGMFQAVHGWEGGS
ncbi:unnamed protein product [Closterium sp. NIES-64]|nr:unnamed protein product [Closterium sp. NIES-64]